MTNTPHGQVPEALRLTHIFDNPLPPEWPDMVAAAAELRRQHTRIAELEAQIGAGEVQALSAAPAVPTSVKGAMWFTKKPVTIQAIQWTGDNLREVITFTDGPPDTRSHHAGMAWDAYRDLVARDGLKIYTLEGKMLASPGDWIIRGVKGELYPCKPDIFQETYAAASPTPPAEQQASATEVALVGAYARLPDFDSGDEPIWEAVFKWKAANPGSDASKKAMAVEGAIIKSLRDFADRTHALRMQAAPKAAPGEPDPADIIAGALQISRGHAIEMMREACLGAAPQQEAQEPGEIPESIERMATGRYKVVPSHESMFHRWAVVAGSGTQQLYLGSEVECQNMARKFAGAFLDGAFVAMQRTAPQPAPAPLSDDVAKDAALWHWLAEYLVGTRTDLDDEIVASKTVNDLRKLVKAARKQGENHDR